MEKGLQSQWTHFPGQCFNRLPFSVLIAAPEFVALDIQASNVPNVNY